MRANPDLKYSKDEMDYLLGGVVEGMQRVNKILPETNAEIRRIMEDTSIFCVSETDDNLLMWSHYAHNHTGAVIKFLALREVDSPLLAAQPVRYSAKIPRLTFASLMDFHQAIVSWLNAITLSKSEVWAYEKEWRVVTSLRNKAATHEILPYAPEEVGAVYLGCKMAAHDRTEIVDVTRHLYPSAKLFQAERHEHEFALVFSEIVP